MSPAWDDGSISYKDQKEGARELDSVQYNLGYKLYNWST